MKSTKIIYLIRFSLKRTKLVIVQAIAVAVMIACMAAFVFDLEASLKVPIFIFKMCKIFGLQNFPIAIIGKLEVHDRKSKQYANIASNISKKAL